MTIMKTIILMGILVALAFIIGCKDSVTTSTAVNCYTCTLSNPDEYDLPKNVCDPDVNQKIEDLENTGYTCSKN